MTTAWSVIRVSVARRGSSRNARPAALTTAAAAGPLTLTTPMPPRPGGVAIATMVSSVENMCPRPSVFRVFRWSVFRVLRGPISQPRSACSAYSAAPISQPRSAYSAYSAALFHSRVPRIPRTPRPYFTAVFRVSACPAARISQPCSACSAYASAYFTAVFRLFRVLRGPYFTAVFRVFRAVFRGPISQPCSAYSAYSAALFHSRVPRIPRPVLRGPRPSAAR